MEKSDWDKTSKRFVAFFDIMGFKDMVQRNPHNVILKKLEVLKNVLKNLENSNSTNIPQLKKLKTDILQTRTITFSDSIVIFTKSDSIQDLDKILLDSYSILILALKNGIGIKGALSYGEITVDFKNHLFFGQPIIDAYLLHEELQLYSAVLDNNIESKYATLGNHHLPQSILVDYKTPMKSGRINHKLICPTDKMKDDSISYLMKIYDSVSGKPRIYIDNSIEFIQSQMSK